MSNKENDKINNVKDSKELDLDDLDQVTGGVGIKNVSKKTTTSKSQDTNSKL